MNRLVVGTDKAPLLEHLPSTFLFIDDEIDLPIPKRRRVTRFDVTKHSLNFLKNITYERACDFVSIINAVFPEGENTLTKRYSTISLLEWLLDRPKSLHHFPEADKDDVGLKDAGLKIKRLLMSPVLERVLTNPTNFPLTGIVLARLNRAELGDFDCFVLGNLLMSAYKGHAVVPDFGFYGAKHHVSLLRQNRLWAGVSYLDESPLRSQLLLIEDKIGSKCLAKDAQTLAEYVGLIPHTNQYNDFIEESVG